MGEGYRTQTACCSVRPMSVVSRVSTTGFGTNPRCKMLGSAAKRLAREVGDKQARANPTISPCGVDNDVVKLPAGAVQREANHSERSRL